MAQAPFYQRSSVAFDFAQAERGEGVRREGLTATPAAMIAWAGIERFREGLTDPLDTPARARWPLDPAAEAVRGAGVKA